MIQQRRTRFSRKLLWLLEDTVPDTEIPPGPEMVEIVLALLSDPGETDVVEIEMMGLKMTDSPPDIIPGEIVASGTESQPRKVARPSRTTRRKTKVFHYLMYIFFTSLFIRLMLTFHCLHLILIWEDSTQSVLALLPDITVEYIY